MSNYQTPGGGTPLPNQEDRLRAPEGRIADQMVQAIQLALTQQHGQHHQLAPPTDRLVIPHINMQVYINQQGPDLQMRTAYTSVNQSAAASQQPSLLQVVPSSHADTYQQFASPMPPHHGLQHSANGPASKSRMKNSNLTSRHRTASSLDAGLPGHFAQYS